MSQQLTQNTAHTVLRLHWAMASPLTSLVLTDTGILEGSSQVFLNNVLRLGAACFSIIRWGLWVEEHKVESHYIKGPSISVTGCYCCWPWSPDPGMSARFSPVPHLALMRSSCTATLLEGTLFHCHENEPSIHTVDNASTQEISLLPVSYLRIH